ncbi:MAG: GH3 auxin-responsive promoter family protein, partial [Acidobacteria bacterium]|nr:GH3 auxin-responsive promoter family protein [Acidobacteriota bacterium]
RDWDKLLDILKVGKTYSFPPGDLCIYKPDLAAALEPLENDAYHRIWPQLRHVSTWADGHASGPAEHLLARLPGIHLEPKGLLCTEGVVSFPYRGHWPLALNCGYFEFEDEQGNEVPLQDLEVGKNYGVILTNMGGLYRYRLHDWIRLEGFLNKTPSIRFLGKKDCVSDLVGEKLNEVFVDQCLKAIGISGRGLLFPVRTPPHYRLLLDPEVHSPANLAIALENALAQNPHYAYARQLGQLGPVQVFWTNRNPIQTDFALAHSGAAPLSTQKVLGLARLVSH